ncbi:MAG: hypothetical protein LBC74_11140 [Planctomycetaceae bacterium]|jgi:hypothetical protein|nr:hypothetical protein [Planctomycetaceae bacterium]
MNVSENSQKTNHENNQPESLTTSSDRSWLQYIFMIIGFAIGSKTGGLVGCILGGMIGGAIGFGLHALLNVNKNNSKKNPPTPTTSEPNNHQNNSPTEKNDRSGKVLEKVITACAILGALVVLVVLSYMQVAERAEKERIGEAERSLQTVIDNAKSGVPLPFERRTFLKTKIKKITDRLNEGVEKAKQQESWLSKKEILLDAINAEEISSDLIMKTGDEGQFLLYLISFLNCLQNFVDAIPDDYTEINEQEREKLGNAFIQSFGHLKLIKDKAEEKDYEVETLVDAYTNFMSVIPVLEKLNTTKSKQLFK